MGSQQGRKRGRDRVRSSLPEGFADCHRAILNAAAGSERHRDRLRAVFLFVVRRMESKGAAETATPCRYKFFGNTNAAPAGAVLRISAVGVDSGKTRCSRSGTRCVQRVFAPIPSQLGLVFRKDRIYHPPVKPSREKYSAFQKRKSMLPVRLSHPAKGRRAIVTSRAVGCEGTLRRQVILHRTRTFAAYGEVVWSWRRDPGVKPMA